MNNLDYSFRRVSECLVILRTPNTNNQGALVVTESHIGHGLSVATAQRLHTELGECLKAFKEERGHPAWSDWLIHSEHIEGTTLDWSVFKAGWEAAKQDTVGSSSE